MFSSFKGICTRSAFKYDHVLVTGGATAPPVDNLLTAIHLDPYDSSALLAVREAYLHFIPDSDQSGPATFFIYGVMEDDPVDFSVGNPAPSTRPRTGSYVWTPVPDFVDGVDIAGPDILSLIDEIAATFGDREGKHLAFIMDGTGYRDFKGYALDSGAAPYLRLEGVAFTFILVWTLSYQLLNGDAGSRVVGSVAGDHGTEPYTYSKVSGDAELTVHPTTGVVTYNGTAAWGTDVSAVFRVTDNTTATADRAVVLPVAPPITASVGTTPLSQSIRVTWVPHV